MLAKVLHTIQVHWFYRLTVTGMRLIPTRFLPRGKALFPLRVLPCPKSDLFFFFFDTLQSVVTPAIHLRFRRSTQFIRIIHTDPSNGDGQIKPLQVPYAF